MNYYVKFHGQAVDLAVMFAGADDLETIQRALIREGAIRDTMAETGEGREVAAEAVDAVDSMGQEAVLDLTDGKPTTLRDALIRYINGLAGSYPDGMHTDSVEAELTALLAYPYPAEEALIELHRGNRSTELEIERQGSGDNEEIRVSIGGGFLFSASLRYHSPRALLAIERVTRSVHRAVLERALGRDHHVQLSSSDRRSLLAWLERPNGSWSPDDHWTRVSMDAVEGGGVLVRTRPYRYRYRPPAGAGQ